MKHQTHTSNHLRRKGILAAAGLLLSLLAGIFAAVLAPSLAARAGSTAHFRQNHSSAFASVAPLTVKDPYTGKTLHMEAGLPFLFVESDDSSIYAYCIQKGMQIFDAGSTTRRAYALEDSMFSVLSAQVKEQLVLVMLYGYPNRTAAALGATDAVAHAATQILLWESALSCRDAAFRRTDDRVFNAYFSGGQHADVLAVYTSIARRIAEYWRTPSFFSNGVLQLELTLDPATGLYSQSFVDTNESNADLALSGNNPANISILRTGDVYTFQTATEPRAQTTVSVRRTDVPVCQGNYGPPLVWVDPDCGAENQLLYSGCESREQSYAAYLVVYAAPTTTTTTPATETTTQTTTTEITTSKIETTTVQPTDNTTQTTQTSRDTTTLPESTTESATQSTAPTAEATTASAPSTPATTQTTTESAVSTTESTQSITESAVPSELPTQPTESSAWLPAPSASATTATTAAFATAATTAAATALAEEVPLTSAAPTEAAVATMALSALALLALGAGALLRKRK